MKRSWVVFCGAVMLMGLMSGCVAEGPYGGVYGGVSAEYPNVYYSGPAPVYTYPYPYRYYGPYDRDHYWDRGRYWERHRWHGDDAWR